MYVQPPLWLLVSIVTESVKVYTYSCYFDYDLGYGFELRGLGLGLAIELRHLVLVMEKGLVYIILAALFRRNTVFISTL